MKNTFVAALLGSALLTPAAAFAQPDEGGLAPLPALPAVAATPSSPPPAPAAPSTCRVGEHAGIEDGEASTAVRLVCAEIARAGGSGGRYTVSLGRLGTIVVLSVTRDGETPGSVIDSREMRLQGIEEVTVAAPRIAEALVRGLPLAETEKVDNLVGGDTRQPRTKPGTTHFALGVAGIAPPLEHGVAPAPGLDLDLHYETGNGRFELGGAMLFGGGSNQNNTTTVVNGFLFLSVGGRYYTNDTDFSPYLGGGLAWSVLDLTVADTGYHGSGNGLGAFADVGFEVLRTSHAHLAFGARLDVPFYALDSGGTRFYYAPLSLEMRLTF